jgi:hypothetical protein
LYTVYKESELYSGKVQELPKEGKNASIQPIYKGKGNQKELENYRGI